MTIDESETFYKCGEIHFVWPHDEGHWCADCRYFVGDEKPKILYLKTGRCVSKASEADRGHIFTRRKNHNDFCHWWFPIGKVAGEQEDLIGGENE